MSTELQGTERAPGRRRSIVIAAIAAIAVVVAIIALVASGVLAGSDDDGTADGADSDDADDAATEDAQEPEDTEPGDGGDEGDADDPADEAGDDPAVDDGATAPSLEESLRDAAPDDLRIGTAVAGGGHHQQQAYPDPFPNDEAYREVLAAQFDSVTPENQLKWEFVHPRQDEYEFGPTDDIVAFAQDNGQDVRGHTLLWHSQNPSWLENGDFTPDELRDILRDHIETVVGRYRGDIAQWDVANEVFDDDAELRLEENIWLRELGVEIIGDAFRWAHEADPDALLFINDYNVDGMNAKSTAYHELIQDLLADDVPIHGFGIQGHLSIEYGFPPNVEGNLQRFDDLGIETAITELDVRMALGDDGPTEQQLERQAADHVAMLDACLNVAGCRSFTLWGFTDTYSWVPHFFGGEGAATVLDEDLAPRPAFHGLLARLEEGR